ncbi:PHD finger protein 7 isoform X2 [Aplysia californica]|uniref:PHD finger protein 7 isoform X2 n=1 Tax=Aplysia californica TaxID=6500 RepID=A0ABM0JTL1_APLCA|nr:PHD finger protein 7 isoform X2 [Aplysia californica]
MTSPCHSQSNRVCLFCRSASVDEIDLGKIHEKVDVTVHYFCMLLSSGLTQNTRVSDKKSILGFTLSDIRKEALRGRRLKCCFCKSKGATIGCCVKTCKKAFHLTCGRQNGTMHHFFNDFRSYCGDHIEQQNFAVRKSGKKSCIICLGALSTLQAPDTLSSPCCKAASFHRRCIQQYALSAGMHFFKCPMCNAVKEFQAEMMKFGIYIPDQDASWEKEPNAFQELLERHDTCDAESCLCPRGRQHSESVGQYMLSLCQNCGSFGSHKACGALVRKYKNLVCPPCSEILEESEKKRRSEGVKSISKVVKKSAVQRVRKRDSRALNSQVRLRSGQQPLLSALNLTEVTERLRSLRRRQSRIYYY